MIKYIKGNFFESNAQALVNTVNTDGIMGKGIALQFKKLFPSNFKAYVDACKKEIIGVGKLFVFKEHSLLNEEILIINFPTKKSWRKPSEYAYILEGLEDLKKIIESLNIKSIAMPALGSGNGGLDWEKVKEIIEEKLGYLKIDIFVYEPNIQITEVVKTEKVPLTDARALLLYVLYDLVKNGEYVSEFSSEKVCYFLQRFGAKKYFKLEFSPMFYGPYSGKVKYVLNALNGSYVMGYGGMDKKPFEPITLIADGYETVINHVENNFELLEIAQKTIIFLNGFYSDFALELFSSIDYITNLNNTFDKELIIEKLEDWSARKRSLFSEQKYIDISINHIQNTVFA